MSDYLKTWTVYFPLTFLSQVDFLISCNFGLLIFHRGLQFLIHFLSALFQVIFMVQCYFPFLVLVFVGQEILVDLKPQMA